MSPNLKHFSDCSNAARHVYILPNLVTHISAECHNGP